jgi:AAA+ superfamily predicted ATPase
MASAAPKLTTAMAVMKNADKFRTDLSILNDAAVGVVLCRSREPFRAIDSIKGLAFARKLPLRLWSVVNGWTEYKPDGSEKAADGKKDPNMALQAVGGLDGSGTPAGSGFDAGFNVMMYPHHWLKPGQAIPALIQALKEYCKKFAHQADKRLVLVVPPGFSLPSELEEDITILDFEVPSYAELSVELNTQLGDVPQTKRPLLTQADKDRLIAAGMGMQLSEFNTAFARAMVTHRSKLPNVPIDDLVAEVMAVKTEVVKRSEVLEVMPIANMENVGGLDELKDWLSERAFCFTQEAADYGIEKPKGVALIGPPGTGKTLCGKATAHKLGLPLIRFDVSKVFAGIVGESESRVRGALKLIDAMAPCVCLLDEVDKAFQRNSGGGDSGVSTRVLGAILTHMQESDAGVFWLATANRVDNLPSEFLRRGRMDEVFSVSVPDTDERLEIIKIHLRKRGKNPEVIPDLRVAAERSDGYVPAELEAAVKDAIIKSFANNKAPITGDCIANQLSNMKPLSEAFKEDFERMQVWADNNARPASRSKAVLMASAAPGRRIRATAPTQRQMVLEDS